ncbi:NAD(P)-binding protein [Archangium violaceum]|uniref:NAD(P)-binding protein n=1 Tax=Archangium violaceum TaxID=83451 RepID=UPI0036D8B06F
MKSKPVDADSRKKAPKPVVYVYGGGVAGMTAAHELAIRGFKVHVYESERALGPRGTLEDPTLGGMARTQYFVMSSEQTLYYHRTPLGKLIDQLLRSLKEESGEAADSIEDKDCTVASDRIGKSGIAAALQRARISPEVQELLHKFFEMLWGFLLSCKDEAVSKYPSLSKDEAESKYKQASNDLLEALDKVLHSKALELFTKALEKDAMLETGLWPSISRDPPAQGAWQLRLREIIERARAYLDLRYGEGLARKKARQAFASALTCALAIKAEGENKDLGYCWVRCLVAVAGIAKEGVLPNALTFLFEATLRTFLPRIDPLYYLNKSYEDHKDVSRWFKPNKPHKPPKFLDSLDRVLATNLRVTQPMKMDDVGGNFPECWLEFTWNAGEEPELSTESKIVLDVAVQYVKDLIDSREFTTEAGQRTDVRILVQSFDDFGLTGLGVLANEGKEKVRPTLANKTVDMLRDLLAPNLGQGLDEDSVQAFRKTGGFLDTYIPTAFAPSIRNWVRVIFYRPQLPGEHGYRLFPSYYRHVFDTMQRIPLQSGPGQIPGGTVLDNLVSITQIGIFSERSAPFIINWTPPKPGTAFSLLDYTWHNLSSLRITPRDMLQFGLRVLRYMTSSSLRRAEEMEALSWWEYLEGYEPSSGSRMYRYSKEFEDFVKSSGRVLAAFDSANGDARTCGNTFVQLLTQALVHTEYDYSTLNGPTSEAWFTHWRQYLEEQDVQFHHGELLRFDTEKDKEGEVRLVAKVRPFLKASEDFGQEANEATHGKSEDKDQPVYFVVATDLSSAAAVTRYLKDDMSRQIRQFAHSVPKMAYPKAARSKAAGPEEFDTRNPREVSKRAAWDRFQAFAGIQFFFQKHVNVFDGYLYCVDAEWGLSAICSHLVWRERPSGSLLQPYQSILSVDIGDWSTPSKYLGIPASECTPKQLQEEVLRQLRVALSTRASGGNRDDSVLPEPDWVHIDESLVYESHADENKPRKLLGNNTPYLIPLPGDWERRPGPQPWDPSPEADSAPRLPYQEHMWQAIHGGYPVYYKRLVFAGTYLKTFTRLTTMESANESARHAVNAILDHYAFHYVDPRVAAWRAPQPPGPSIFNPYERGLFPTSPQGDYCRIWDPERNELPDFELLQRQDEENFLHGRSHPLDTLGLEVLPSLLSRTSDLREVFDQLLRWVLSRGAAAPQATQEILTVLRHLRGVLESKRPPRR